MAVGIGVGEEIDVGDAESDDAVFVGVEADGNVQTFGEGGDFASVASAIEAGKDFDFVAARFVERRGVGIFAGLGEPEPALGVECHVDGFADVRLGGDQLDLETWRKMKGETLLFGREPSGFADDVGEGIGGVEEEWQEGE